MTHLHIGWFTWRPPLPFIYPIKVTFPCFLSTSTNSYIFILQTFRLLFIDLYRTLFSIESLRIDHRRPIDFIGPLHWAIYWLSQLISRLSAQYLWHSKIHCQLKNYYRNLWCARGPESHSSQRVANIRVSGSEESCLVRARDTRWYGIVNEVHPEIINPYSREFYFHAPE